MEHPFVTTCPCCGEKIKVFPWKKKAVALGSTEASVLDFPQANLKKDEENRQDRFLQALEEEKRGPGSLDDLLGGEEAPPKNE
jgi:hypothetical protein